jgi:hypothetical protein
MKLCGHGLRKAFVSSSIEKLANAALAYYET